MNGRHTQAALTALMLHLTEMMETVELAINSADPDQRDKALAEIATEYHGPYTKASRLAGDVAHAMQTDDDEVNNEAYQQWLEAEEAVRVRMSERPM